ncbi:MAG: DUF3500 domain-containing protein [Gemmataceae bacterium]
MNKLHRPNCPECTDDFDRRDFLRAVGTGAAALGVSPVLAADAPDASKADKPKNTKPAEDLIRELFAGLDDKQKEQLVLPWNHGGENGGLPTRLRTYNAATMGRTIGKNYTKPQQELVERILKAILSNDEAFTRISRNNTWDASRSFENCSALIFGDPNDKKQFAWLFAGHHLTVRCDGNSEPGAAFGGPMYYGHLISGYNPKNVWNYQTKKALEVFDALDEKQKEKAIVKGSPGDREAGLKPRNPQPGIELSELSADQQQLVEVVMRSLLDPFRKEDADEVMEIVKTNGGQGKIHLAFYTDGMKNTERWDFWRLEGPGFIWNFRVLPHVHTYVNIAKKA